MRVPQVPALGQFMGSPEARAAPGTLPDPRRQAQSVADLIDRIDVLVRSRRPTLSFTLKTLFAARVEVEKTGPGQVSLRIQGWNGPPPPADLARIRDALRERGLNLTSLSVG